MPADACFALRRQAEQCGGQRVGQTNTCNYTGNGMGAAVGSASFETCAAPANPARSDPRLRGDDALAKAAKSDPRLRGDDALANPAKSDPRLRGDDALASPAESDPRLRGDDALAKAGPLSGPAPVRHLASTKM